MLFMGVGAALLILIVVLVAKPGKNSKDGKVDPTPTEIVAEVPAETAPELTIEEPVTEEGTEETQTVEDTSTAGTASAPVTTTYCDYEIRDGIPNTVNPIGIGECEQVDDSYFDDAVFVGDSVTLGLAKTVKNQRKKDLPNLLGQAQFLTCGGMGIRDTLMSVSEKSLHPVYQGEKMLVEDALAKMGAKKIFLMLGMNDIVMASTEENVQNMMKLLVRIREKNPDAIIFIESCTPRAVGEYKKLNNNALFEFDIALYEECKKYEDMGLYFIDIGYALRDDQGWLPEEYCGDLGSERLHMSAKGCKAWITYLYTHALREA